VRRPGCGWTIVREHLERWPTEENAPIFANEVGAPLRRTLFRSRIWRPSLVRAGLLGQVRGEGPYLGRCTDVAGERYEEEFRTRAKAVGEVARRQAGGMRFHDLRHSYATWLVDDGVPVNMSSGCSVTRSRRRRWICTPGGPTTGRESSMHSPTKTMKKAARPMHSRRRSESACCLFAASRARRNEIGLVRCPLGGSDQAVQWWAIQGLNL
jgi:hypothetical protein